MQIGSRAHKELFCRAFFDAHHKYQPADLPWPELDDEALAILRGLPFWTHALQFESDAGPMITAVAAQETDPLIREALELQAFEETRHAELVQHMIDLYGLHADEVHVEVSQDVIGEFIDFGFEECLDSFGAFGLFKLARDSKFVPDPLFDVFDNVMREEANHIVFFINWYAHHQANRGAAGRWLRVPKSLWHYTKALTKISELVRDTGADEGADFIVTGAQAFVDELTPRLVIETCLAENERRLASFDRRLLVPRLVPSLAQVALAGLRLVPRRSRPPGLPSGTAGGGGRSGTESDRTPRAA